METDGMGSQQDPVEPKDALTPSGLLRRQWFRTVLATSILVVWLIPLVVSVSPLFNRLLALATAKVNGKVTVKSATLGWLTPVSLNGVVVRDRRGQTVAEIERVSLQRTLLGLACNHRSLGRICVQRPSLTVMLRNDGSNLEDLLARCVADIDPAVFTRNPPVDAQIDVVDGKVAVHDVRTGRAWQIDHLQGTFVLAANAGKPLTLQLSGTVANRHRPGQLALSGTLYPAANAAPDNEIQLRTDGLPLAIFGPLLARVSPTTHLRGRLTSSLVCHAGATWDRIACEGTVTGEDLRLADASRSSDPLKLAKLDAEGKLAWENGQLAVERLAVKSDLGELTASGTLDPATLLPLASISGGKPGENWSAALMRQVCQIRGRVDLARLAATFPGTLRIRKGTEITAGQASLTLAVQPDPWGSAWSGQVEANGLTATNQGRKIAWQQPIQVTLAGHATAQGPVIESLKCESNFLRLEAAGTAERMAAAASFDLSQLSSQLAGFVDLGQTQLAGSGWAQFQWQRLPQQTFQTAARVHLDNFHFTLPGRPAWVEENLTATVAAAGQTDLTTARLDTASIDLVTGRDQTSVRLLQPVADLNRSPWPVEVHSEGDLGRWIPRLAPWCTVSDWQMAGTYNLGFKATASPRAVRLDDVRIVADQLQLQGPGLHLAEPHVQATLAGGWDSDQRRLDLRTVRVGLGGLTLSADGLVVGLPADGRVELAGVVDCQGDLGQLQRWTMDPAAAPDWRIAGQFASRTEFRQSSGTITGATATTVRGLSVLHASGQQFQEPEVRLTAQAVYDVASGTLSVQQAQLSSDCLAAGGSGRLVAQANQRRLDADGKLDYDLDKLSALARSVWGPKVQVSGRGSKPFTYHGPLSLNGAGVNTSLAWQSAQAFGFQAGPGELQLSLDRGVLTMGIRDLPINEGRVRLAPQIRLASSLPATSTGTPAAAAAARPTAADGLVLYHGPGRIAEQIRINPELCAQALKYVAPVMAHVGTAEGRFSVDIDRCVIPLAHPSQGELLGRLTIHTAQVDPGPLVEELAVLLGRASPARISQESVINFRMADGRVYHEGMELVFPDLTIRTQGWVGFDDTLSLTAEMTVPPKWLAGNPSAPTLRSQTIRLPVAGTLKHPLIDRKVLAQTSAQFLRNAAHNLIQEEFHRQVDRLLKPTEPVR